MLPVMTGRVVVNPAELAGVAGQVTGLADQVHASVEVAGAVGAQVGGANPGFVSVEAAGRFWGGWQPALLASGTRVAQFGDDLAASGTAWREADAAHAEMFRSG
jgi:hypothetical protein